MLIVMAIIANAFGRRFAGGLLGQERTLDDGLCCTHDVSSPPSQALSAASTDLADALVMTTASWRRMS